MSAVYQQDVENEAFYHAAFQLPPHVVFYSMKSPTKYPTHVALTEKEEQEVPRVDMTPEKGLALMPVEMTLKR